MITLANLKPAEGAIKNRRRVGRGPGSGRGKTSGRGSNGSRSRSGYSLGHGFEGGQMTLIRRIPKRGFTNIFKKEYNIINLDDIDRINLDEFKYEDYFKQKLARKVGAQVKILGKGELKRKVKIYAHKFSEAALEKIKNSGSEAIILGGEAL